jgi:multicomponent Na+:H+ antiporter subunit E
MLSGRGGTAGAGARLARFGWRALLLAALWLVLVEGHPGHLSVAVATIVGAAAVATYLDLGAGWRLRPLAVLRFVPFFLRVSIAGGVDVARRAFHPGLPLDPGMLRYRLRLAADTPAATFFVGVVSLLPGTLCAEIDGAEAIIHVVDLEQDNRARLGTLEDRIAALFGVPLDAEAGA